MRPLVLALALAACSSSPPEGLPPPPLPERAGVDPFVAARAEGVRFMASGEAFQLRFYDDRILISVEGAVQGFPKPNPLYPRWNGEIYNTRNEAHELEVRILRYRPCPAQSGQHVVEVRLDAMELNGCGREI